MKHIDLITEFQQNCYLTCLFTSAALWFVHQTHRLQQRLSIKIFDFSRKKSRLRNEQKQIILKASNFLSSNKAVRNGMKVNSINIYKTQNNNNRYLDVNLLLQTVISLMQIGSVPSSRIILYSLQPSIFDVGWFKIKLTKVILEKGSSIQQGYDCIR